MTTPSTERKAGPLLGTGAQTAWPFTFKVFAATDIAVTIADNLGVETALVYGVDYNVTLNANQETSPGGTVTYPISGSALPVGKRLVIFGNLPYDQPLDLPSGGNFSPLALENQLDRLTMQIQQLREQVGRAVQVSVTTSANVGLPPPTASNLIGWNENGDNLENYPLSELATSLAFATYRYDTFTGNGSTTQFTLSADPVTLGNLDVAVGGVTQTPGTDYLLVAGVLAFTSAPPNGVTILARFGEGIASGPSMDSYDVRFRQAGTGAVDRTAEAKMRESVSVKDFGAVGDGVANDSAAIQAAITTGKNLYFPAGTYLCNLTIPNTSQFHWYGDGSKLSILKAFTSASPVVTNLFQDPDWCYSSITDIGILGQANYEDPYLGIGFAFGSGLVYPAGYSAGMEIIGRVVFNRVQFRGLNIGVYKPYGNIGNTFNDCTWQWLNYGYYAQGLPALTHAGADTFRGGQLNACEIAAICILDATPGTGDWNFDKTIIQFNRGFGIFADFGIGNTFRPLMIDIWDEANGTAYVLPNPSATVTIETLTGPQILAPKGVRIEGLRDYTYWGKSSLSNGIGTLNPQAPLGIWGNQRSALNLIGGGFGADWTALGFSSEGSEATKGATIQSFKQTGTDRNLVFSAGSFAGAAYDSNGSVKIGNDAVATATPADGSHLLYGNDNTAAAKILGIGATAAADTRFYVADADLSNAANTVVRVGKNVATSRSINAGGTVNASGADYAEYMAKAGDFTINKGEICGINADGKLTNLFSQAVSFVVKSTNPSYVGGDTWGAEDVVGQRPEEPARGLDQWAEDGMTLISKGDTDEEYAAKLASYEAALAQWIPQYEAARQTVDRIAFSGQVPVNVTGASAGQYIVPVQLDGDAIGGAAVSSPTFEQYQIAVGKVIATEDDGRARIIVKIA